MLDREPGVGADGLGGLDTLYVAEEAQVRKYEWTSQGWTGRGAATYVPARGMAVRERDGRVEIHVTGESGGTSLLARAVDDTPFGGTWHRLARDFTVLASSTSDRFLGVAPAPESLDLAELALEGVVLEPEFDGGRREYRGLTTLGALSLRARTDAAGGTVEVREEGGAFGPLTAEARELRPGQNRFEVRVRSGHGLAGPVYRVEVGRLTPPEVGAAEVSRTPGAEVTVSAEVISDGGGEILERGIFCESPEGGTWIPADGPPSTGKFSVVVSGLEAGRSYVFRGYARNRVGRQTGEEVLFTTETFLSERLGVERGKPRAGVEGSIAPFAVAVGRDGELFFADAFSHTIRKLTREGKVVVVAGSPGLPGGVDGEGAAARFHAPHGLAFGKDGALYVADTYNHAIRRISDGGGVSTHAGELGMSGARDGTAGFARFSFPKGLVGDASGNLLVADTHNHVIRLVGNDGEVVTVAGKFRATGSADGTGSAARFEYPHGLALGQGGVVYVADSGNRMIRLLSADGTVTTVAGLAKAYGSADGKSGAARFANPRGVAVDGAGTVYVTDTSSRAIRVMAPDGMVGTLSFRPAAGGEGDRDGFSPHGIAVDRSGVLYVADPANRCIRRIYRGVPGSAAGQR
jgi:sugar lactone lactonase YvrE